MKTNVINLDNSLKEIDCAFQEVNKFCVYQDLSEKETLRFQLLAEEAMGILKNIAGEFKCKFWAESTEKRCELHFQVDTIIDIQKRHDFLDASTSGKNSAAKGIMGKVRNVMEAYMLFHDDVSKQTVMTDTSFMSYGMPSMDMAHLSASWSLHNYKTNIYENRLNDAETEEAWDELEKSIVAKLADDVQVSIRGNKVELVVYKEF